MHCVGKGDQLVGNTIYDLPVADPSKQSTTVKQSIKTFTHSLVQQ